MFYFVGTPVPTGLFVFCSAKQTVVIVIFKFPNRIRRISTPWLNPLLDFHLVPINVIISYGSTISYLEAGFTLRCFQRLSIPDLATLRCPWQDSRHTRGQFTPVLSSLIPLFLGGLTISSPLSL